jgi:hypothetical protein
MAYARWGWDGSDVYVFLNVSGWIECCSCWMNEPIPESAFSESFQGRSADEMIAHLREHVAAGHTVPEDLIPDINADRERIDSYIAENAVAFREEDADA